MDTLANKKTASKPRSKAVIDHPLLNKWLTANIINNLPDETAQAVADLIQAAVKRQRKKKSVNAHTSYESQNGGGKTGTLNIERLREALLRLDGEVIGDEKQQP